MDIESTVINLNSHDPEALHTFYRDVVGLPPAEDSGPDALAAGGTVFTFDRHQDTAPRTVEPARVLVSLFVPDIDREHDRLVFAGVPCIRDRGVEFWGGVISTFVDPDGNYFQLIQYDPSRAFEPLSEVTVA